MNAIKATYLNGQFVPDEAVDWPEGKRVIIAPADSALLTEVTDDEPADDPESIARWIAEFDAIPPLQMTAEEEADWQAAQEAQKEFEKATFFERAENLRRMYARDQS